jgi:hypothetical protein
MAIKQIVKINLFGKWYFCEMLKRINGKEGPFSCSNCDFRDVVFYYL